MGDKDGALKDYDKAIDLNPNESDAYFNRGIIKDDMGKKEDALKDYDIAIKLNPNDYGAYFNHGIILYNLGEKEDAIKDFSKAIELNPNFTLAYEYRADCYRLLSIIEIDEAKIENMMKLAEADEQKAKWLKEQGYQ